MPVSCQRRRATVLIPCTLLFIRGQRHAACQLDHFDKLGQVFGNNEEACKKRSLPLISRHRSNKSESRATYSR